ncbi:MAG: hypothetical protein ACWA6R_11915, partial [Nitrosomonas sp.]
MVKLRLEVKAMIALFREGLKMRAAVFHSLSSYYRSILHAHMTSTPIKCERSRAIAAAKVQSW